MSSDFLNDGEKLGFGVRNDAQHGELIGVRKAQFVHSVIDHEPNPLQSVQRQPRSESADRDGEKFKEPRRHIGPLNSRHSGTCNPFVVTDDDVVGFFFENGGLTGFCLAMSFLVFVGFSIGLLLPR